MRKAIVYGGAGFVGNAVVRNLLGKGYSVYIIEQENIMHTREAARLIDLADKVKIITCDLKEVRRLTELIKERDFDIFFQFAWDGLEGEKLQSYRWQISNIQWTMESIETAARLGCKKFIGAGSISEQELLSYDGRLFQQDRHSYYRSAQFACETMGRSVAFKNNIEFFWPQIINIYGPGEFLPRLVTKLIKALQNKEDFPMSPGEQLYDFIYIDDAAEAFTLIAEKGKTEKEYIIGSGNIQPLKEYLKEVRDIINPDAELQLGQLEYKGLYMKKQQLNIDNLLEIGFQSKVTFKDGIQKVALQQREEKTYE